MGLLSFLFGGKEEKPKAAKPAGGSIEAMLKESTKAPPPALGNRPKPRSGVLALRLDYAARAKSGDPAAAYAAACRLAAFYKKSGATALAVEYRAAATAQLGRMLVRAAKGRAAKLAAARVGVNRTKLADAAQAKLIAAHRDWLAGLQRRAV